MTSTERKLESAIKKAKQAWEKLREAETAFQEAWEACAVHERHTVVGDSCLRTARDYFNDMGA